MPPKNSGTGSRGGRGSSGSVGSGTQTKASRTRKSTSCLTQWQCIVCDSPCDEDNSPSIECFICKHWAHQECAKLSDEAFELLNNPCMQWVCCPCTEEKAEVKSRADAKLDELLRVLPLINSISDRLEKLEAGLNGKQLDEKIEEIVERKVAEAMEETQDKEKRKKNVIIHNVQESRKETGQERREDDLKEVLKVFRKVVDIADTEVEEVIRLGKVGGRRPRLMKVKLKTEERKKEIMKKAPEVNKDTDKAENRIYINNDETPKEREQSKKLRLERKERIKNGETDLVIRGGKVVKRREVQADHGQQPGSEKREERH